MRLQTDPTVIYGITKGEGTLGRGLRASELAVATPYNTYVRLGLPPAPIANPGAEAIAAAANPEPSDYLYFVADGTGGHAFATTLEEHNRNVAAWRRIEAPQIAEERGGRGRGGGRCRRRDRGPPVEVEGTPGKVERPMPRVRGGGVGPLVLGGGRPGGDGARRWGGPEGQPAVLSLTGRSL